MSTASYAYRDDCKQAMTESREVAVFGAGIAAFWNCQNDSSLATPAFWQCGHSGNARKDRSRVHSDENSFDFVEG